MSTAEAPESQAVTSVTRGQLLRWLGWFGISNALVAALIGTRYLLAFGAPQGALATVYVALTFIAQFAVLGVVPLFLLLAPVAALLPQRGLISLLAVLLVAGGLAFVVLDTNIFAQYRYHLNGMTIALFDTQTWVFAVVILFVLLAFQSMLAGIVWKQVLANSNRRGGLLAFVIVMALLGSQGIHIWADATAYSPVTSFTRYLPAYFPMKAKRRLAAWGLVDPAEVEKARMLRQANAPDSGQLLYPINPLACDADAASRYNVLIVLVDALRPDILSVSDTPTIFALAEEGQHFRNHYSGGNSSRMGVFSMFYGLPSTYWQAFYDTQRQPLVMEQFVAKGYAVEAFSAVGFGSPAQIDRTVFSAIPPEQRRVPDSEDGLAPNLSVLRQWRDWLASRSSDEPPFFSFVYLDPGNATRAEPDAEDELTRKQQSYMHGVREIDSNIGAMLEQLESQGLRDETLVIVTSDHGYEFDELGLGYVGHASNYGPYQLRSTLVMDWPGRAAIQVERRTAHQDLPATLLEDFFACSNPPEDYSSGSNLFGEEQWDWIVAGSYNSHAIVQPDMLVVTNPGGLIELLGPDYKPDPDLKLDAGIMEEAVIEMRRFYR